MTKLLVAFALSLGLSLTSAATVQAADAAPDSAGLVKGIKVLPDKAPDSSSLKSMAMSVTRGCKTNDDKLIALYNFMILSNYHRAYPPGGPPLLWFNNYGWSLCGGLANLQSSLFHEMGWGWRGVHWPGHNMAEAKYDGTWHWFDCFQKFYAWRPDANAPGGRTIACQDDLAKNLKGLVTNAFVFDPAAKVVYATNDRLAVIDGKLNWMAPAMLTCGDTIENIVKTIPKRHEDKYTDGQAPPADWVDPSYSADVNLLPGYALVNTWGALLPPSESWPLKDKEAVGHTCGNKDLRMDPSDGPVLEPYFQRVRSYCNGTVTCVPDFSSEAVLQSFVAKDNVKYDNGALVPASPGAIASVTVLLKSPFIIEKVTGTADGADSVAVSANGRDFQPAKLEDLTPSLKNKLSAYVKISFKDRLTSLKLESIVLNNSGVLPFLSPGKNTVTVSVADPAALGTNKLVVTYAYAPGFRNKSLDQLGAEGRRLFAQVDATWDAAPTVVQKVFAAGDLPATFEIDVPTPKGKYAVYPRMLFMRRQVIAANSQPPALPADAKAPKVGPDDELQTLPNPFMIGTQPPPATQPAIQQASAQPAVGAGGNAR